MNITSKFDIKTIKTDLSKGELRTIYTFLISFFIGLLKPVRKSDLEHYIRTNTALNLRPYFNQIPKQFLPRITEMVKNNSFLIKDFLTGEKLIEEAQKKRPDLYEVLNTYKGRAWTDRFMAYIHKVIFTL